MIGRIIDFSVKHKFLVFAVVAVACVFDWRAMVTVAIDAIPDMSDTQVIIYSRWDCSPDVVEVQLTYPRVTAIGAPGLKRYADSPTSTILIRMRPHYQASEAVLQLHEEVLPGFRYLDARTVNVTEVGQVLVEEMIE